AQTTTASTTPPWSRPCRWWSTPATPPPACRRSWPPRSSRPSSRPEGGDPLGRPLALGQAGAAGVGAAGEVHEVGTEGRHAGLVRRQGLELRARALQRLGLASELLRGAFGGRSGRAG